MNRNEFLFNIKKTYNEAIELIVAKNADYATESDPWRNFRCAELVGVSPERAILVRVSDKLARIANIIDKGDEGIAIKEETVTDTLLDAINYLAILKAKIDYERETNH